MSTEDCSDNEIAGEGISSPEIDILDILRSNLEPGEYSLSLLQKRVGTTCSLVQVKKSLNCRPSVGGHSLDACLWTANRPYASQHARVRVASSSGIKLSDI